MPASATGTPTSPDNLATLNTSADAPDGIGINNIIASVQTAFNTKASKPSGIVSGEVPVWNGTTWVRSSATNIGPTSLGSGTPDATKFLRGDGSWQVPASGSGTEMAYAEINANVNVLSTTEATGTLVVAAPSFTADGTSAYRIEFYAASVGTPAASVGYIILSIFEGVTQIGRIASLVTPAAAQMTAPVLTARKITPAAGAHTYSITAFVNVTTGSPFVGAGAGGTGVQLPTYIRITKA